jgi:hypothetical protein
VELIKNQDRVVGQKIELLARVPDVDKNTLVLPLFPLPTACCRRPWRLAPDRPGGPALRARLPAS